MKRTAAAALILLGIAFNIMSQEYRCKDLPRTMLECSAAKEGVLLIIGTTRVGEIRGIRGGSAVVEAKEVRITSSVMRDTGISVNIIESKEPLKEFKVYVDYDEIPSLLSVLDYFAKINHTDTGLDEYQAVFRTRGGFELSVRSIYIGEGIRVSGIDNWDNACSIYLSPTDLPALKDLIRTAKQKLDFAEEKEAKQ
jgi:hypothetical protein